MNIRLIGMTVLLVFFSACAATPETNSMLEQARASVAEAQSNLHVVTKAPDELNRALEALREAEEAWDDNQSSVEVEHLAYLTIQRSTIAQQAAAVGVAQDVIDESRDERQRLQLAVLAAEAESAQRQLSATEQRAERSEAQRTAAEAERRAAEARAEETRRSLEQTQQVSERRQRETEQRIAALETEISDLEARPALPGGSVVVLNDVLFELGKSRLLPGASNNLARLADVFKEHPDQKAVIYGYTDNLGPDSINYALSQQRADTVRNELIEQGVSPGQLSTRAYGPANPVTTNDTAAGRQLNRRVEIVFTPS
jgi:outer membrane protein OmpA-like peptidoglycan-associated protein